MQTLLHIEKSKNQEIKRAISQEISNIHHIDLDYINYQVSNQKDSIDEIKRDINSIEDFKVKLSPSLAKANFDVKSWQDTLESLKKYSKINKINLSMVKNFALKSSHIKQQTLNMQVIGNGKYKDIINFIADIESISVNLKVKDIEIDKKDILEFKITLQSWKYNIKGS
jgi:Tfp pilus assembly protein PilO